MDLLSNEVGAQLRGGGENAGFHTFYTPCVVNYFKEIAPTGSCKLEPNALRRMGQNLRKYIWLYALYIEKTMNDEILAGVQWIIGLVPRVDG